MSWIMDKLGLFCPELLLLSLDYSTLPYNIILRGCANKHGAYTVHVTNDHVFCKDVFNVQV